MRKNGRGMESGVIVLGLIVLLYGFYSFDRVVLEQYRNYRAEWERVGKPHGIYWRHSEGSWLPWLFSSGWATNRITFAWLFKTPDWVKQSPTAQVWLRRYRVSTLLWNVMAVVAVVIDLYRMSQG